MFTLHCNKTKGHTLSSKCWPKLQPGLLLCNYQEKKCYAIAWATFNQGKVCLRNLPKKQVTCLVPRFANSPLIHR